MDKGLIEKLNKLLEEIPVTTIIEARGTFILLTLNVLNKQSPKKILKLQ